MSTEKKVDQLEKQNSYVSRTGGLEIRCFFFVVVVVEEGGLGFNF